ncbi:MAG: hypothetical protein R6U19_02660, partial [Bacteroidales bacterium]
NNCIKSVALWGFLSRFFSAPLRKNSIEMTVYYERPCHPEQANRFTLITRILADSADFSGGLCSEKSPYELSQRFLALFFE